MGNREREMKMQHLPQIIPETKLISKKSINSDEDMNLTTRTLKEKTATSGTSQDS